MKREEPIMMDSGKMMKSMAMESSSVRKSSMKDSGKTEPRRETDIISTKSHTILMSVSLEITESSEKEE